MTRAARPSGHSPTDLARLLGDSPCMRTMRELIQAAARTKASVLLRGETGTGKTLVARAMHALSERGGGPLVHVDCTSLPAGLIESELFGHERGAFTGAERLAQGKVERAQGGTLLLDEIGDLPLPLQGKLLRLLQDRRFERVGGRVTLRSDARVISATNVDLERRVDAGAFRSDLYYRVRVVELIVPPLRERGRAEIARLAQGFVERFARSHRRSARCVAPAALRRLQDYAWPGNVRELEHCIESATVLCHRGETIEEEHLSLPGMERVSAAAPASVSASACVGRGAAGYAPGTPLAQVQLDHMRRTLEHCGGNRSEAARQLGIGRNTLLRRLPPRTTALSSSPATSARRPSPLAASGPALRS
jgi:Nif-specific regulatory protein